MFLGDSLTYAAPMGDFFSTVKNRGIGGDTTAGVLSRLDEVTSGHPRQIFLMIGTNDVAREIPVAQIVDNYGILIHRIRTETPDSQLFVEAVLPVNQPMVQSAVDWNTPIHELNIELARLAKAQGVGWIDMTPSFLDSDGNLKKELTIDGLHLNIDGRVIQCNLLRPYVRSSQPATTRP